MICILRDEPSAVPKRWFGLILADRDGCAPTPARRPPLERVVERARPQVSALAVCTRANPSHFADLGLPVVRPAGTGPLASVLAGLDWTAARSRETAWLVTFPGDTEDFPLDLVEQLGRGVAAESADMAWAAAGDGALPAFGLWPVRLRRSLRKAVGQRADLGAESWAARFRVAKIQVSSTPVPLGEPRV